MATERKCTVQLTPCKIERRNGIESVSFLLFDKDTRSFPVTFRSLDELTTECKRLVQDEFKAHAACYVRLPRGERKPPGFDKATRTVQTIRYTPPGEPVAGACS